MQEVTKHSHAANCQTGRRVTEVAARQDNPDLGVLSSTSLLHDLKSHSPGRLHWSRSTTQEVSWQLCVWLPTLGRRESQRTLAFLFPREHCTSSALTHAPRHLPITLLYLYSFLLSSISLRHLFYRQHKKYVFVHFSPVSFVPSSSSILCSLISCLAQCFPRLPAPCEVSRRGVVATPAAALCRPATEVNFHRRLSSGGRCRGRFCEAFCWEGNFYVFLLFLCLYKDGHFGKTKGNVSKVFMLLFVLKSVTRKLNVRLN